MKPTRTRSPRLNLVETDWTRLEQERNAGTGEQWFYENYQPAILKYLRSRFPDHEAQDICQEFFATVVLRRGLAGAARRDRGSLRALLQTSLGRFLNNHAREKRALKRGGAAAQLNHCEMNAQDTGSAIPDHAAIPPDQAFDRAWAAELLERALSGTELDCIRRGKGGLFAALRPALEGTRPVRSHAEIAEMLGVPVRTVTLALNRLRQRVARRLYDEVAATVAKEQQMVVEWESVKRALDRM